MSAHIPCDCNRRRGDHSGLVVVMRNHNCSAFNGYHWTPSAYSEVMCIRRGCRGMWRSKDKYVDHLPDMELMEAIKRREGEKEEQA